MDNKNILIVTLKGCSRCSKTKEFYSTQNIKYSEVNCDEDPSVCDELEDLTKTNNYPMVVIKDNTKKLNYIFYIKNSYNTSELYNKQHLDNQRAIGILCNSLESLIEQSKKIYDEI